MKISTGVVSILLNLNTMPSRGLIPGQNSRTVKNYLSICVGVFFFHSFPITLTQGESGIIHDIFIFFTTEKKKPDLISGVCSHVK